MTNTDLQAYVQSAIAIIVVLGGGITMVFRPELRDTVIPVITLILGFYFGNGTMRLSASIAENRINNTISKTG